MRASDQLNLLHTVKSAAILNAHKKSQSISKKKMLQENFWKVQKRSEKSTGSKLTEDA